VVVDGLKAGNTYSYFITPLCVTAKAPFNLDRYGTPFTYGLVVGPTISFTWCEVNNKANWGAVQEPGGEANRGYYEVYNVISRGEFVARSSSGGGGGSGGGLCQEARGDCDPCSCVTPQGLTAAKGHATIRHNRITVKPVMGRSRLKGCSQRAWDGESQAARFS